MTLGARVGSNFICFILLARCLSIEDFGNLFFLFTVANLSAIFVELGLQNKLSKDFSNRSENEQNILLTAVIIKTLFLAISICSIYFYLSIVEQIISLKIVVVLLLSVYVNSIFQNCLIRERCNGGWSREAFYSFLNGASFVIVGGVSVYFISSPTVLEVSLLFLLSRVLSILVYISLNFEFLIELLNNKLNSVEIIKYAKGMLPYFVNYSLGMLFLNVDVLIAKPYIDDSQLGVYQAGVRLFINLTMGSVVVNNVLIPRLMENRRLNVNTSHFQYINKLMLVVIPVLAVICIALYLLSPFIISLTLGAKYDELQVYASLFCIIIFMRYVIAFYSVPAIVLSSSGVKMYPLLLSVLSLICLVWYLFPKYGISGLLYSSILAHALLFLTTLFLTVRYEINQRKAI